MTDEEMRLIERLVVAVEEIARVLGTRDELPDVRQILSEIASNTACLVERGNT